MTKQTLDARGEVLLWKAAWDELQGYVIQKSGDYKSRKARLTRLHIRSPMPNDLPRLAHHGAKRRMCIDMLNVMASIRERLYKGRSLAPWQNRKMAEEMAGEDE